MVATSGTFLSTGEELASDTEALVTGEIAERSAARVNGWVRRSALVTLLGASFAALALYVPRSREVAGSRPGGMDGVESKIDMSPEDAARLGVEKVWQALGDGHRVAKDEGTEILALKNVSHISECIKACDATVACLSFAMCRNDCFLKSRDLSASEPSRYSDMCSSYFGGYDSRDDDSGWLPKMSWTLFGGGSHVPEFEGPSIAHIRGPLQDCQRACEENDRCVSFAKCGKDCWLKDVPLTGGETTEASKCNYYFQSMHGVPPPPECPHGQIRRADGPCEAPPVGSTMSFYLYRAQSAETYPFDEGLNMANAAGVMWYLHNEVVGHCPRKFRVVRVIRFKVTMRATSELAKAGRNFDQFLQFDGAKCTNPRCDDVFNSYGYVAGCIKNSEGVAAYPHTTWFSFPGVCPFQMWDNKTAVCRSDEPGGFCSHPDGSRTCTYNLDFAGDITMEDLTGIRDYDEWCKTHNELTDIEFWRGKNDTRRCQARIERLKALFYNKYPDTVDLGEPSCDWR